MVFSAVSVGGFVLFFERTMIHTIWSGWARKKKQEQNKQLYTLLRRTDAVRSRMKAERGKIVQHSCFIQTEKKLSSSYLVVGADTLGPVHLRRGRGRVGGWGGTSSMRHVRLLV